MNEIKTLAERRLNMEPIPCRVCGNTPTLLDLGSKYLSKSFKFICHSTDGCWHDLNCGCGDWQESKDKATEDWNRRMTTPVPFAHDSIVFTIPLQINSSLSLNRLYAGEHWTVRKKQASSIHQAVQLALLAQHIPQWLFDRPVTIHISYNSKLDVSNHGYLTKLIEDGIKGYLIKDDSQKYVKAILQDIWGGIGVRVEVTENEQNR